MTKPDHKQVLTSVAGGLFDLVALIKAIEIAARQIEYGEVEDDDIRDHAHMLQRSLRFVAAVGYAQAAAAADGRVWTPDEGTGCAAAGGPSHG